MTTSRNNDNCTLAQLEAVEKGGVQEVAATTNVMASYNSAIFKQGKTTRFLSRSSFNNGDRVPRVACPPVQQRQIDIAGRASSGTHWISETASSAPVIADRGFRHRRLSLYNQLDLLVGDLGWLSCFPFAISTGRVHR